MVDYSLKLKEKQQELSNINQETKDAVNETKDKDGRLYSQDALQNYQNGIDKKKMKYGNNGIEISVYNKELNLTNTDDLTGTFIKNRIVKTHKNQNKRENDYRDNYIYEDEDNIIFHKKKTIKKEDENSFLSIFLDTLNQIFGIEPDKDIEKNLSISDRFNHALKSISKSILGESITNSLIGDDKKKDRSKDENKEEKKNTIADRILKDKIQHGENITHSTKKIIKEKATYIIPTPDKFKIRKNGIQFIPIRAKTGHAAGICIDNINKKITIFEPNGESLSEIETLRGAKSKKEVLSRIFNKQDAKFLQENGYQLCDGNRRCQDNDNIQTLPKQDKIFDGGIAYSKRDNTTDSCAVYTKEFMEKMTKNFLTNENGKIKDYQQTLQETNNKIKIL